MSQNSVATKENVITRLTAMFAEGGMPNPTGWIEELPPIARAENIDPKYQRFLVNSYWRHALGLAGLRFNHDTSDARYTIVDADSDEETLVRLYKLNVLPWIIKLNLPTALQS